MKKLLSIIFILTAFAMTMNAQNSNNKSLYERLGGTEGITVIVDDAVTAHTKNSTIAAIFTPYLEEPERLAVIKKHTVDFFVAGSGGPSPYTGRAMPDAHKGMNISAVEYMAVVDDILMVLDKHQIDTQSKNDVLAILWSLKGMIMAK